MMCRTDQEPDPQRGSGDEQTSNAAFAALLEDSVEELYETHGRTVTLMR